MHAHLGDRPRGRGGACRLGAAVTGRAQRGDCVRLAEVRSAAPAPAWPRSAARRPRPPGRGPRASSAPPWRRSVVSAAARLVQVRGCQRPGCAVQVCVETGRSHGGRPVLLHVRRTLQRGAANWPRDYAPPRHQDLQTLDQPLYVRTRRNLGQHDGAEHHRAASSPTIAASTTASSPTTAACTAASTPTAASTTAWR